MSARIATRPRTERGAALLTVLLLVALMAVISASAVERLTLATRLAASTNAMDQARHFTRAAEAIALRRITTLAGASASQVTLAGGWYDRPFTVPLPDGGRAELRVTDGGNCFNLNSLVAESTVGGSIQRPLALAQFVALMQAIGIGAGEAATIGGGASDWIDADQQVSSPGAEDASYSAAATPHRTADRPMTAATELRAVAGVTPGQWARLAPWVCALPTSDLSPINVNTLQPEQAALLQMLLPTRIDAARARAHIAARPSAGYGRIERFWNAPTLAGVTPTGDVAAQVSLRTRWFRLQTRVEVGDVTLTSIAIIDAGDGTGAARIVRRTLGPDI